MVRHHKIRMHENQPDLSCPICGHAFPYQRLLKAHIARHADPNYQMRKRNKIQPPTENTEEGQIDPEKVYVLPPRFYCEVEGCGKSYITSVLLLGHMRARHMTEEERKVSCDICGKEFLGNYLTFIILRANHFKVLKLLVCILGMPAHWKDVSFLL